MNSLNIFFDKIFLITSYDSCDRLKDLIPILDKHNIKYTIVVAPKKKYFNEYLNSLWIGKGAASLISSIESIFLESILCGYDSICIIEDDLFFDVKDLNLNDLPENWDIINFGYHFHTSSFKDKSGIFLKINTEDSVIGTHIVAYKNSTFKFIIDSLQNINSSWDLFLNKNIYTNFNSYLFNNSFFYASSYREYELDKNLYYKKYKSLIN